MKCPNCGVEMNKRGFCTHCGYMENGNFIKNKKKKDNSLLELYFGDKYDYYVRNENYLISGLLGPIYIIANNYTLIGLLLTFIDVIFLLFIFVINHAFLFYHAVVFLNICALFLNRVFWATFGNMIYIKLMSIKLNLYKKFFPKKYKSSIKSFYKVDHFFLHAKYVLLVILFFIVFRHLKKEIYEYLKFI